MEFLIGISALLFILLQFLAIFSVGFYVFMFLRFGKVKGWFNKKAGAEIVSSFSLRTIRTLCISLLLAFVFFLGIALCLGLTGLNTSGEIDEGYIIGFGLLWIVLSLIYPVRHLIRRISRYKRSEDKKAAKWRLFYDLFINVISAFGGLSFFLIMPFVSVVLSLTKWDDFAPRHFREMTGFEVVPQSIKYYAVGVVLGFVGVLTQFMGSFGETLMSLISFTLIGFAIYMIYKIYRAGSGKREPFVWRYGYIILTTYVVFTITWMLILVAIALLILYIILTYVLDNGPEGKYKVSCDYLTDDVIAGRGICSLTHSRCEMRDTGRCPMK